jgi:hypothetical protein
MQTTNAVTIHKIRWRYVLKTTGGRTTFEQEELEGPAGGDSSASPETTIAGANSEHSTTAFVLRRATPTKTRRKRLVDEGFYDAHCIDVRIEWNKYRRRHDAELDFKLLGISAGLPS